MACDVAVRYDDDDEIDSDNHAHDISVEQRTRDQHCDNKRCGFSIKYWESVCSASKWNVICLCKPLVIYLCLHKQPAGFRSISAWRRHYLSTCAHFKTLQTTDDARRRINIYVAEYTLSVYDLSTHVEIGSILSRIHNVTWRLSLNCISRADTWRMKYIAKRWMPE